MKSKRFLIIYICWIAFIWINSSIPAEGSSQISGGFSYELYRFLHLNIDFELFHSLIRKCAHFTEYTILGILACLSVKKERRFSMIAGCILVACLDETLQLFVPGRSGEIRDVLIDASGVIFGMGIYLLCEKIKHNKSVI